MQQKIYDTCVHMRGQVWQTQKTLSDKPKRQGFRQSSVMEPGHPILITSSYFGNKSSTMVTGFMMSSTNRPLGVNIQVRCPDEVVRTIFCAQPVVLDKSDLSHYLYSVTDEVVEVVLDKFNASCDYNPKEEFKHSISAIRSLMTDIQRFQDNQDRLDAESHNSVSKIAHVLEATYRELKDRFVLDSMETPTLGIVTDDGEVVKYNDYFKHEPTPKRGFKTYLAESNKPPISPKPIQSTDNSDKTSSLDFPQLRRPATPWKPAVLQKFMDEIESMKDHALREAWAKSFGYKDFKLALKAYYNINYNKNKQNSD